MSQSQNLNNGDSNESSVLELKESEPAEKFKHHTKEDNNKSFEMNDCPSNDSNIISNELLEEKNEEHYAKIDKIENKISNYSEGNIDKILNKNAEGECRESNKNTDGETDNIFNKTIRVMNGDDDRRNDKVKNTDINSKLSRIIDSDSEDENMYSFKTKKKPYAYEKAKDETSDSEDINEPRRHSNNENNSKQLIDNDSDDSDSEAMNKKKVINIMKSRFQTLIDSESEEETERKDDEESARPIKHHKKVKQHKKENSKSELRKVSLRAAKDEAMKQIQSETQRLMREAKISLPYHKPKQRTLQEFLNRKKVITVLPTAPTMAAKLKMSSAIVDEVLKEKEKEAEIFYKSSDSEEEIVEMNKENINKGHPNTECTKISQKDNASRKLFVDNNLCTVESSEGKNSTNTMKEMDETLTEIKETENNEKTVLNDETNNDANDLMVVKTHDEKLTNITENKKEDSKFEKITETTRSNKIDGILQRDIEIASKEENSYDNSDEYNSKIAVAHEDTSTSKSNYDYANMMKESLGIAANELDDYNEYGLPPPKFHDSPNMNGKKSLQDIKSLKPKLRGTPGTVIDLTSDIKPCKKGVNDLIDRFMCKHSKVNEHTNDTSEVTVTQIKESVNGLTIIKTPLPYRLPIVSDEDPKFNKPGAKLTWLKEELKHKMAMKRDEEWKQREQEMKEQEIEWNESIDEEDNYLNEPYSPSIESHKTEVDELEEYDVHTEKSTKRKKKSAFIDDEAEVSGDEISDNDEIEDEDEDEDEEYSEEEECQKFIIKDDDENNTNRDSNDEKCKTFKRIVIPLEEDSRSSIAESNENSKDKEAPILQSTKIGMFGRNANENELLFSNNDSDIPVSQACVKSDLKRRSETPQSKINTFDLVSPITQLTALNVHLEEESELLNDEKPLNNTIFEGGTQTQALFQQVRDCKKTVMSQKKLFSDHSDVLDEELLEICSGKFPKDKVSLNFSKECNNVSESQLLELCSGTFSSQSNNENNLVDFSDEIPCSTQISEKGGSLCAEKDEQQSKKETITWNKLRVLSSDDEDEVVNEDKQKKKKVKKLNLSDDEEDNSSASSSDNEHEEDEEKFIDYDSEENEVVIPKKDIKQYAAKFLEEEAELSESDCDVSADEDEEDLDNLELEDADNEEIDEMQVKNQLGKLHMKQLLDEDQKEVKMLQELLFEDGDLYSESTRKRKFKWRNIDKQDENDDSQPLEGKDGWVDLSDEEDEIKWRKMKYERDKFLAEKMKNIDAEIENDLNNSEVFKFGLKILKKRRIDELQTRDTLVETIDSTMQSKTPHSIAEMYASNLNGKSSLIHNVMQKHSFLARGEESLARLATLVRKKDASITSMRAKHFVFTHVDLSMENESDPTVKAESNSQIERRS